MSSTTILGDERLRERLESLPDVLFVLDEEGVIEDCLGGDSVALALPRAHLVGKRIASCPAGVGPLFASAIEDLRNTVESVTFGYTLTCAGAPIEFEARVSRSASGGFLAVVREVRAGENVEAERMWKAAFDATAEGILVIDPEGNYVASNRVFHDMWRIPRHMLYPGQERAVLDFAKSLVLDVEDLIQRATAMQATPDGRSSDVIRLKDGRFFECVSAPQRVGGECVGRVWSFRDITDRVRAEQRTRHDAYHDPLTGLPNRALFQDRLAQEVGRSRRAGGNAAVLLLDLDRFKTINDTLGHAAGDQLLVEVGRRLQSRKREGDTVARLGGDEFVFIVSSLRHKEDAAVVAEQLLAVLRPPIQIDAHDLHVSASIGISIFPDDGEEGSALLKCADMALYRAKELGRNNYQVFEEKLNKRALERLVLENDLRRAIRHQEFMLQYQPQFDLATGKMRGLEALVRWQQGDDVVPPSKFVSIAEECGLIVQLGRWVLWEAARVCAEINAKLADPLRICVNVSALQIQRPNFANEVSELLSVAGLPPHRLVIELTESALMQRPEHGSYAMEQLQAMDVGIAMDDFGTGHSSLNYVSILPISLLKIDRSFVMNCAKRKTDAAILAAIVTMGHALGLKVLAEGVETKEQEEILRAQGCDEVQGYLYSRPISKEQVLAMLGIE